MSSPDKIGKYRVIAKLGQGGMAKVLLTVASGKAGFEKLLVVKELRQELAHDPEFVTMFLDEARLAARLNHPNVVHTYEVGQDGDHHYIAMDYLEGQSLMGILRKVGRDKVPLDLHVRVLADVLSGLDYAHTLADFDGTPLRVVHRDMSPHNVFVTYDGQVKVVDFGIAKAVGAAGQTKTGVYKGKVGYIAPEQARALPVDGRADVFAVGVMLWEAIARRRLASTEGELAVLAARIGGFDPPIRDVVPDAPAALAEACDKAMALDAANRFESAAAMRDALEAWLDAQPKRAGAKELGALVSQAFAAERSALRTRVDEQLKAVRESSQGGPIPVIELGPHSGRSDGTPSHPRDVEEVETVQASNLSSSKRSLAEPRSGRGWLVGLGVAALAVVGVVAATSLRNGENGTAPSSTPEAKSATVEVVVRFGPDGAVATLDGATLQGSPFRGRFPKDASSHTLEVRAPGHVTEKRIVALDRDLDLTVDLAVETATAAATASAAPTASPVTASPRRPGGDPTPRSTSSPGSQHAIDEQNPYKK